MLTPTERFQAKLIAALGESPKLKEPPRPTPYAPDGVRIPWAQGRTFPWSSEQSFLKGWFEVQDQASQHVAEACGASCGQSSRANLAVPFTVGTNTTQKVLADARAAVAAAKPDDWQTPLRAATFAIENRVDLEEANKWLDQSIKANENIRNLFEKARAQAMAGDRTAAIATAQKAISKAGEKDKDEVGEIQHSIASWQGKPASSR